MLGVSVREFAASGYRKSWVFLWLFGALFTAQVQTSSFWRERGVWFFYKFTTLRGSAGVPANGHNKVSINWRRHSTNKLRQHSSCSGSSQTKKLKCLNITSGASRLIKEDICLRIEIRWKKQFPSAGEHWAITFLMKQVGSTETWWALMTELKQRHLFHYRPSLQRGLQISNWCNYLLNFTNVGVLFVGCRAGGLVSDDKPHWYQISSLWVNWILWFRLLWTQ